MNIEFIRTRQIIRYRATATLRRPQLYTKWRLLCVIKSMCISFSHTSCCSPFACLFLALIYVTVDISVRRHIDEILEKVDLQVNIVGIPRRRHLHVHTAKSVYAKGVASIDGHRIFACEVKYLTPIVYGRFALTILTVHYRY